MSFLEQIKRGGVIGCGGAGFPAQIKWKAAPVDYFIVNAVECEPLLCTDRYLMRHFAEQIILSCCRIRGELKARRAILAVKGEYTAEIEALEAAIAPLGGVTIHRLSSFYPAGDEQVVVREVTGRTVPYGGIPLDVGAVVSNVATVLAAYDAVQGRALTDKYLTVAGEVQTPCVVKAPVGTSVQDCLAAAGGILTEDPVIVAGGPMMGKLISQAPPEDQVISKTTSGLLVFPRNSYMDRYHTPLSTELLCRRAATACIQCSYCTMLCPRHMLGHPLEPHRIMRALAHSGGLEALMSQREMLDMAALCSLCGVCTAYACPMGLQPSRVNERLKAEMANRGIRRDKGVGTQPDEYREMRKVPTGRLLGRLNLQQYEGKVGDSLREVAPRQVSLALRQGAGKTPEPRVAVGDAVRVGDLIAEVPENAVGSDLQASIDGVVTGVTDKITIVRR